MSVRINGSTGRLTPPSMKCPTWIPKLEGVGAVSGAVSPELANLQVKPSLRGRCFFAKLTLSSMEFILYFPISLSSLRNRKFDGENLSLRLRA
jgi:hypothetical protein